MAATYKTLFNLDFFKYSYFAKIMTRKPEIGNLTNMTKLESKKGYWLFKAILWSRELLVKTFKL